MVYTVNDSFLAHMTLKSMEELLPAAFIRVYRSYIVNKEFILSVGISELKMAGKTIPLVEK